MSKRTESTAQPSKKIANLHVQVDEELHLEAKSAIARKGKSFREVVEKALTREVETAK